jgi:hypothetical protein
MVRTLLLVLALSVAAAAQTHQVSLSWTNVPQSPVCTVAQTTNLYRATSAGQEGSTPYKTGLTGTTFIDTAVTDATTYFYQATAVCSTDKTPESVKTSEITAVIPAAQQQGPPPAPGGFTGTVTTLGASLNWNAVPGVNSYDVFKTGPGLGRWHYVATATAPSYLDKAARAKGASYAYFVASFDGTSDGTPSIPVTVTNP